MRFRLNPVGWAMTTVAVTLSVFFASRGLAKKIERQREAPTVRALRRLSDAIEPLHAKKGVPSPGEWLSQHREPGQTLTQYLASEPNTPTARLTTMYLQPVGDFSPTQEKLLAATGEMLA